MDADEKVIALKKAYADIILNISKEAAARVMSSERIALKYAHELKEAKEEALRMLLHLKQMMDARNSKAEASALNQDKKIEELEAQLGEAEDIVRGLREELGEVQTELERLKKTNLQDVNELDIYSSGEVPATVYSYESSKLASGLYRNGCTQRIRACERNLLDKELCLREKTDLKDKNNNEEQKEDEFTRKAPSIGNETGSELEKKLLADIKLSSFQPFCRKRKRSTKQRVLVTCLTAKLTDLPWKPDELPELSMRLIPVSVKDDAQSSESPSTIAPILSQDEGEKQICQGVEESLDGRILQKDDRLNEQSLGEQTGFTESLSPPFYTEDVEKADAPPKNLDCTLSNTCKGLPSQPVRERIIKYTFQRKRKRGPPSKSEVTVSPEMEKSNVDKKNACKSQELSKASLLSDSSRDSRQLAQVARQLISLSENKWWN